MLYSFKIIRLQRYGKSPASGLNHQFGEERVPTSLGNETMLPGIEEGETLAEVGQSDARTAVVFLVLGEKAVFDAADDVVILLPDVDADERGLVVAHPVLESILDERDEEQGGDFDRMLRLADIGLEHGMEREADTHQFDVVADEIQLLFQGDTRLATVVEDVAEEAAEVVDGALRLFGAESDEAVDIIQGVEEEMGVELALQALPAKKPTMCWKSGCRGGRWRVGSSGRYCIKRWTTTIVRAIKRRLEKKNSAVRCLKR